MPGMDTTPTPDPRSINIEDLEDGDLLRYDEADQEFKRVTFADLLAEVAQAAPSVPAAITGGEAPTEAEFLALRTTVDELITALVDAGVLTD